jgi:CubicO group peptidase (beta-lactamase class C family)
MNSPFAALNCRYRGSRRSTRAAARSRRRPRIEGLEERVMLTATPAVANPIPNSLSEREALQLQPYITAHDFPGISVAVVLNGQVALARGYGLADAATGAKVQSSTPFDIGSVTKTFTALAVLYLYQEHKIASLDDPISDYLSKNNKYIDLPSTWSDFTIRQLLQMSTGIVDVGNKNPWSEQVASIASKPFKFTPAGSGALYSNANFYVLGALIERLDGGLTYAKFLETDVFPKFGLTATEPLIGTATSVPGQAIGYDPYDAATKSFPVSTLWNGEAYFSSGDIVSTAADMGKYIQGLLNFDLLTPANYQTMWTSTPLPLYQNTVPFNPQDPVYDLRGLAWDSSTWSAAGPVEVAKNGEAPGYSTELVLYPTVNKVAGTDTPYSKGNGVYVCFNTNPIFEPKGATYPTVGALAVANSVYEATQTGAVEGTVTASTAGQPAPAPLAGVRLYIDTHGTGIYERGDPWTQTSATGTFVFNDIPPGTYELHLVPQTGYIPKQPNTWTATVVVAAGDVTIRSWALAPGKTTAVGARAMITRQWNTAAVFRRMEKKSVLLDSQPWNRDKPYPAADAHRDLANLHSRVRAARRKDCEILEEAKALEKDL